MSEERKKRETTAVTQPQATTETASLLTKQLHSSPLEEGDINNEPRLGLLILEKYRTSVPTVDPDNLLFEYTDNLVSFSVSLFDSVEGSITVHSHSRRICGIVGHVISLVESHHKI